MKDYKSYEEIHYSYQEMERTMDAVLSCKDAIINFFSTDGDIIFLACGSSYWMSLSAAAIIRFHTGRNVCTVKAGDVVMSPDEHKKCYNNPTFVAPSRSGLSRELIDALKLLMFEYPSARLFSITEYEENEIKAMSSFNISIPWANEISVCQTRSFNCLYVAFLTITSILSGSNKLVEEMREFYKDAPELYRCGESQVKDLLENMGYLDSIVALGVGRQYGVVVEGAYISIEMAQLPGNYYQTLEYRHGPIVTAKKGILVLICSCGTDKFNYEIQMAEEIEATGATAIIVGCEENGWTGKHFTLGKCCLPEIISLYFIFIAQCIAYNAALIRNADPDNPGELVRFITY